MPRRSALAAAVTAAIVLLGACGGGDDDATDPDGTDAPAGDDTGAIGTVEDAQQAVVRIEAAGTFAEPGPEGAVSFEEVTGIGSGSGFIIDAEGTVVTNNHVVAGAATLKVYVGAEEDEPVSAKVLGVSECNDLAVIDLEGDGYPFLRWADDTPKVNRDVRALGFPLGDPEFTVTSGIVTKAEADGDTPWASIPATIEHDAAIQPGNSGGPLVNADDASVVAVNYATNDPGTGQNQFFAISAAEARDVVERLREGEDVLSIGVNGQAISDTQTGAVGIWVGGVESGSPAEEAGIEPGDIIEKLEGLPVGTDGTMKDYCDILRSHDATDQLSVQVLRFADFTRYRGELNGDALEPVESLVDDVESRSGGTPLTPGEAYEYTTVQDDTGLLVVDVPTAWGDLQTETVSDEAGEYAQILAAPDVQQFLETFDVPGMSFAIDLAAQLTVDDWLAASDYSAACTSDGAEPYDDGLYTGSLQVWYGCGGTGAVLAVIAAGPPTGEFSVRVVVQALSDADLEALDRIVQSFRVVTE
jgi:serine protease Do